MQPTLHPYGLKLGVWLHKEQSRSGILISVRGLSLTTDPLRFLQVGFHALAEQLRLERSRYFL